MQLIHGGEVGCMRNSAEMKPAVASMKSLLELSLVHGVVPVVVFGLTALLAAVLLVLLVIGDTRAVVDARKPDAAHASSDRPDRPDHSTSSESSEPMRTARYRRERSLALPVALVTAVAVGVVGFVAAWLCSDVFMVFGVSLGWPVIRTVAAGFAACGFLVAAIVRTHRIRRVIAIVLVPLTLVSTALGVDSIYGEYQTVGSLVGYTPYASIDSITVHRPAMSVAAWRRAAGRDRLPTMPDTGKIVTVAIPNTRSNFTARKAMIYLPPAALSDRPPALPVMELLAGQPGSPGRLIDAGNIAPMMNAYAAKHDGLAPVVVVPDQNGESTHNSLCADTTQGNAETYLTRDVVDWAKAKLPVAKSASMWAIGGFSQGGTCTTQLAPRHPEIYGAMLPVDGELKPTNGSVASMVRNYFAGDRAAYDAQVPVNAIAATGSAKQALFAGAGARDKESVRNMRTIAAAARKAGMDVTELAVPGTGHDWHAVQAVWRPGVDWFGERTGLGEMTRTLKDYSQVEVLR